jgi:phosphoglycerate kinase
MEKEVEVLTQVRDNPDSPMVAILGGAKVSDKMGTVRRLSENASHILVGGAMTYTFMKATGYDVGNSLVEEDRLQQAKTLAEEASTVLHLPTDHVYAASIEDEVPAGVAEGDIPEGQLGLDIGPATVKAYNDYIAEAQTIIWNGPMGVFETEAFAQGTLAIADAVADATDNGAFSVVGGGDSVSALNVSGKADRISHVSTGGGAMLQLLEGASLPGVDALTDADV